MVHVPRIFVLLDELEKVEKGQFSSTISYGLANPEDTTLSDWDGSIVGPPHTVHECKIYTVKIHCNEQYPDARPTIRFVSKINISCVDQETGEVDSSKLTYLRDWKSNNNLQQLLEKLRKEMGSEKNKHKKQPPDGSVFS